MQFLKNSDEDINIGLTSLIDVIFLLLIFFMVTTTLIDPSKKLDIQLPEAKAASPNIKSIPVTIELGTQKKIFLNGKPVSFKNLESRLLASEGRVEKRLLSSRQTNAWIMDRS